MAGGTATLLDRVMPRFDFGSRHARVVDAPMVRVCEAVESARFERDMPVAVRLLTGLRGLGAPRGTLREAALRTGFSVLAETPGNEVVLGVAGRFWAWRESDALVHVPQAEAFMAFDRPGFATAAMNVAIEPLGERATRVTTETRVRCVDRRARVRFAVYWILIRPFSGLIRRWWLDAVARRAATVPA